MPHSALVLPGQEVVAGNHEDYITLMMLCNNCSYTDELGVLHITVTGFCQYRRLDDNKCMRSKMFTKCIYCKHSEKILETKSTYQAVCPYVHVESSTFINVFCLQDGDCGRF